MKILIKVTKEILERSKMCGLGENENSPTNVIFNCAIALAVRDIFPEAAVSILSNKYRIMIAKKVGDRAVAVKLISKPLCKKAAQFIMDFDLSGSEGRVKMKPFEFEVKILDSYINTIDISELTKQLEKSETLELVEV